MPLGAAALALVQRLGRDGRGMLLVAESVASAEQWACALQSFGDAALFPDNETLPYDNFSPHGAIISARLELLARLLSGERLLLVVAITSLMQRLAPPHFVSGRLLQLRTGQRLDRDGFAGSLVRAGYEHRQSVVEHGQFCMRGSLMDLYPMGFDAPLRIDLLDDCIDSIRTFDPESQRTTGRLDEVDYMPAREFSLDADSLERFQNGWHESLPGDPRQCPAFADIRSGVAVDGAESWLPLFHDSTASLHDYLPGDCMLVESGDLQGAARAFWQQIEERHHQHGRDPQRPLLPPAALFVPPPELERAARPFARLGLDGARRFGAAKEQPPMLWGEDEGAALAAALGQPGRSLICAGAKGRLAAIAELLARRQLQAEQVDDWAQFCASAAPCCLMVAPLGDGFALGQGAHSTRVIADTLILGRAPDGARKRRRRTTGDDIRNLAELAVGDLVVHQSHGLGRYASLTAMDSGGGMQEFLVLEYAGGDKLYVPVSSLHLVSRYVACRSTAAEVPLHRLGGNRWQRARSRAARVARDSAAELLAAAAERAARPGLAMRCDAAVYERFCAEFPFQMTEGQRDAERAVLADMERPVPMDRLICGDVGFGKTEVAIRAAFVAAQSGCQVLVLVPTTLLASQHCDSFQERMASSGVRVDFLSRLKNARAQAAALRSFADGRTAVLIGTHALLHKMRELEQVGLLIIDEEHRFGVRQKKRLRDLRARMDVLTMTATPIPRTLNMALSTICDLSIITTPPPGRHSIHTFVCPPQDAIIRDALRRELLRGGQVFYIHNDIATIAACAERVRALVPQARIRTGHGRMRESELEDLMSAFQRRDFDVLVATTIVETGIDMPRANTIVIERADRFGLAQLHQLRGRVGRSHHQAWAYLLHPQNLSRDAERRLAAIVAADALGSGFTLATQDLEIRGAGDILGESQSGQINSIGFELYNQMLARAIESLRRGEQDGQTALAPQPPEIDLHCPALIPDSYLADLGLRLVWYKRLTAAADKRALRHLQEEMSDRFGAPPQELLALFHLHRLRLLAEPLGLRTLDADGGRLRLAFGRASPVSAERLVALVQKHGGPYRLAPGDELYVQLGKSGAAGDDAARLGIIEAALRRLVPLLT